MIAFHGDNMNVEERLVAAPLSEWKQSFHEKYYERSTTTRPLKSAHYHNLRFVDIKPNDPARPHHIWLTFLRDGSLSLMKPYPTMIITLGRIFYFSVMMGIPWQSSAPDILFDIVFVVLKPIQLLFAPTFPEAYLVNMLCWISLALNWSICYQSIFYWAANIGWKWHLSSRWFWPWFHLSGQALYHWVDQNFRLQIPI